jgi:hypothetical protein
MRDPAGRVRQGRAAGYLRDRAADFRLAPEEVFRLAPAAGGQLGRAEVGRLAPVADFRPDQVVAAQPAPEAVGRLAPEEVFRPVPVAAFQMVRILGVVSLLQIERLGVHGRFNFCRLSRLFFNLCLVNPPVHGWATIFLYRMEQALQGKTDLEFLKRIFGKLTSNFGWWVNRKDRFGRNLFEGGFLGLDNIGVFDRSSPLPTGGCLEQADGTAWMALYSQNMIEIAVELAAHEPAYEDLATNFLLQFGLIARAMNEIGPNGMWDEEDGFYYDVLRLPDGSATRLKVRSMVGLLPLCAATVVERWQRERVPRLTAQVFEVSGACRSSARRSMQPARDTMASLSAAFSLWSTRIGCAASSPECSMRTSFSAPMESGHCPAITPIIPISFGRRARNTGWITDAEAFLGGGRAAAFHRE